MFSAPMVRPRAGGMNLRALANSRNGNAAAPGALLAEHRQGGQRERRTAFRWRASVVLRRFSDGRLRACLARDERTVDAAPRDKSDRCERLHADPLCTRSTRSRADVNRWNYGATSPTPWTSTRPPNRSPSRYQDVGRASDHHRGGQPSTGLAPRWSRRPGYSAIGLSVKSEVLPSAALKASASTPI